MNLKYFLMALCLLAFLQCSDADKPEITDEPEIEMPENPDGTDVWPALISDPEIEKLLTGKWQHIASGHDDYLTDVQDGERVENSAL
jgi:hypothetical protein